LRLRRADSGPMPAGATLEAGRRIGKHWVLLGQVGSKSLIRNRACWRDGTPLAKMLSCSCPSSMECFGGRVPWLAGNGFPTALAPLLRGAKEWCSVERFWQS